MSKFKIGDRVRRINDDFGSVKVGDIGVVGGVDAWGVRLVGDSHNYDDDNFEPWAPKVGERVRIKSAILTHKRRHVGGEFVVERETYEVDGKRTWAGDNSFGVVWLAEELEPLPVAAPEPALTLEAGKFYRTRDGRKVGPLRDDGCGLFGADGFNYKEWYENGRTYTDVSRTSPKDLIAEWQETTNVGAQVDTLAEEYGPAVREPRPWDRYSTEATEPKFKVGDRVECIDNRGAPTDFKVGEFYTVTAVEDDMVRCGDAGMFGYRFELAPAPWSGYGKTTAKFKVGDRVRVMKDGKGIGGSRHYAKIGDDFLLKGMNETRTFWRTNGPDFYEHEISLAHTQPTAIVALIEDGKPKPADIPHVHANQAAAEREAKRLAGVHKGKQFGVYVLATTAEEPAPVYAHEWQRLAAVGWRSLAVSSLVGTAGIPKGHAERIVGQFAA